MKLLVNRYYHIFINIYTIWILYLLFFMNSRNNQINGYYLIRPFPFQSIRYVLFEAGFIPIEMYKNILGNIILFIPYGFLGLLYPTFNNFKNLLVAFLIVINILEFSQYFFNLGFAELDDVILNTLGMSIGYMIYKKWFFIKGK